MRAAYGQSSIVGGPSWIDTARFDVLARAEQLAALNADAFIKQAWQMLQTLLEDRFALRTHVEARQVPIYALVVARADGALGTQLTKSDVDCAAVLEQMKRGQRPPVTSGKRPPCTVGTGPGRVAASAADMAAFAGFLGGQVDRPVSNRTGLMGNFDLELTWSADDRPGGVSIFTALQEQLGLKLQPTTGPVEVLVIDSAQAPSPD
jgi:uncharacterized protein (TIGR03435 family)